MGVHKKKVVYRSMQRCKLEYRGLQEYACVNIAKLGFTRVCMGVHSNTGKNKSIHTDK